MGEDPPLTFRPTRAKRSPAFYAFVLVGSIVSAVLIGRFATNSGHGLSEWDRQQAIEAVFDELDTKSWKNYHEFSENPDYFAQQTLLVDDAVRQLKQLADGRSSLDVFARVYIETAADELDQLRRSQELWAKAYKMNAFLPSAAASEGELQSKIEVLAGLCGLAEEHLTSSRRFYRLYERELRESGFDTVTATIILDEMRQNPQFAVKAKTEELGVEQMALILERAELLQRHWGEWWLSEEGVYFDQDDPGEEYRRLVAEYETVCIELDRLIRGD